MKMIFSGAKRAERLNPQKGTFWGKRVGFGAVAF